MKKITIFKIIALFLIHNVNYAQTDGTLTFSFNQPQPTNPAPNAGIKCVLGIWIEDNAGNFVKTKRRNIGTSTKDHLPTWAVKSGGTLSNALAAACNVTDATTGATLTTSTTPTAFGTRSITWDGKNVVGTVNGTTVADGIYKIWIESSWVDSGSNNHNELISFSFTKGPTAVHLTPTGDTYINNVVLDWTPSLMTAESFNNAQPFAVFYPVPTTGLLSMDIKNEIDTIKIFDLSGKLVYFEEIKAIVNETKQIDLSNLESGNYVVSVSNSKGTSSYEIIKK